MALINEIFDDQTGFTVFNRNVFLIGKCIDAFGYTQNTLSIVYIINLY